MSKQRFRILKSSDSRKTYSVFEQDLTKQEAINILLDISYEKRHYRKHEGFDFWMEEQI